MSLTYQPPRLDIMEVVLAALRAPFGRLGGQKTRVLRGVGYLLLGLCAWTSLLGCSSLGVATSQQLPEGLPQDFHLKATAAQVWQVVAEEARAHADCILTEAPKDHLISWCENVANWRDLGQDAVVPKSLVGGVNPDAFARLAQMSGKGTAVTTIWIEDQGAECTLHVRRVYFGSQSFSGVAHSRGEYEHAVYQRLQQRLGIGKDQS